MKKIIDFEKAAEILRPYWEELEQEFNQHNLMFATLSKSNHDTIGRVLRSHLIIENFINKFLELHCNINNYSELNLTFYQKVKMLPTKNPGIVFIRPAILQVNSIRNKFAHRLGHTIAHHEMNAIQDVLSLSRRGEVFSEPVDAIEAFTQTACAFLCIPSERTRQAIAAALAVVSFPAVDENE